MIGNASPRLISSPALRVILTVPRVRSSPLWLERPHAADTATRMASQEALL
jgi:hypothetical protein